MKDPEFDELLDSVREAGKIHRGEVESQRCHVFAEPDVRSIRQRMGVSQVRFAQMIGVSARTLQNWEQGHRRPTGPARVLLHLVQSDPENLFRQLEQKSCP